MASHRKARKPLSLALAAPGTRSVIGLTSAALATVTLLSETASAAPAQPSAQPSIADVQAQVDQLNHDAEVATMKYDQAQQNTEAARKKADALMDQLASGAQQLNTTRRTLGQYAAAQYRTGGLGKTAQFFLATDPQQYFDQSHLLNRASGKEQQLLAEYETQQAKAASQRSTAAKSLQSLTEAQQQLAADKATVQKKLTQAQNLLNSLTAQQKARLAALQKQKEEQAQQEAAKLAAEQRQKEQQGSSQGAGGSNSGSSSSSSYAAKAAKAIAFAKAQLGKPYVWGATGPNSYDCSGLTQAAWAAAGVTLPRTTWDQVNVGHRVAISDLQPGDLVFYYSDISHVAMYIGNGQMIQAPHTGAVVDIQPVTEMPIYGATRPA
ncbi:NlpC/P60 family protein [Streptantibioticus rubrisoli]|uniref:C40 family peptidase n=1 Tax=Streptantibioticus rubrisoli TaxID=1387313 RepID=A0ABT1PJJ5_9ACTN|nr:C40 family peptidase [Streptantibioticus rubrisoli]MCQ4045537.1 C40 family peptidase [Streptantibioticus rubrisoli]